MEVHRSIASWIERRAGLGGRRIGFVPTMGALHRGHASLVVRCRAENDVALASIFVNPTQFNDPKDLERYPRTLEDDLAMLESLGTDHVIAPEATGELYPLGRRFRVEEEDAEPVMEALHRPGFLHGVATVVLKLLNIARAQRAYFGEKDYQQLRMVADLARDFFTDTEIVACPTVREDSGLAESSRNRLLSTGGRIKAAALYRILSTAVSVKEASALLEVEGFAVDYVEEHWGRRFAAVRLEGVRLIDNVPARKVEA